MKLLGTWTCLIGVIPWLYSSAAGQLGPLSVQWQRVYGGTDHEEYPCIRQTSDGGFYVGTATRSDISGNKTSPKYDEDENDYWVIRLDANGHHIWDRTFGGTAHDTPSALLVTADGGCLVGGFSYSTVSGNKETASEGGHYWMVCLNNQGDKLWEQSLGGSSMGTFSSMVSMPASGFILAGQAWSDPTGDKSMTNFGRGDLWIRCLNADGERLWDRGYGGTNDEYGALIGGPNNESYILASVTTSGPSGNKSSPHYGGFDYWVLKVSATGEMIWERTLGGPADDECLCLCMTRDGGCVVAGSSLSGVGGTKTSPAYGHYDYWVIRLDSLGNQHWERSFGGTSWDKAFGVVETSDGGFLVAGESWSQADGNKVSPNFGYLDVWLVRLDTHGNELWQQTFGGTHVDKAPDLIHTADGYALACSSQSPVSGNKTVPGFGIPSSRGDVWILKFYENAVNLRSLPTSADLLSTSGYRFLLTGPTNSYVIEHSSNLTTWHALQTNRLTTDSLEIQDPSAATVDRRFYRARMIATDS